MLMLFLVVFGIPSFVITMVTAYLISNTFNSVCWHTVTLLYLQICVFSPLHYYYCHSFINLFKVWITLGLRTIIILRIIKMAQFTCVKYLTRRVHKHPHSPPLCLRSLTGHRRQRRGVRSVYKTGLESLRRAAVPRHDSGWGIAEILGNWAAEAVNKSRLASLGRRLIFTYKTRLNLYEIYFLNLYC